MLTRKTKKDVRTAAREAGERFYFTGLPCKNGHISKRWVNNTECSECRKDINKRQKLYQRHARLQRKYGISTEGYSQILTEQGSKCKICGISPDEIMFHVDHCHDTGKVRGLLCSKCNQAIGLLNHSAIHLLSAIKYLEDSYVAA